MTFFLYGCDYHGDCTVPLAVLSSEGMLIDCSDVTQDLTSAAYVVDNNFKVLALSVQFTAGNDTDKFAGAIIGYQLQVSPDPSGATFTDVAAPVPPVRRGARGLRRTAGCGGGKCCPDALDHAREMAAFLAKALGLNWSQ